MIEAGDIILYHGRTWVSRQILKWMNVYRKKLGLKERSLFNHVSVVVEIWGELFTVEAVARGVIMQPVVKSIAYSNIKVKKWRKPLTWVEKEDFNKFAIRLVTENIEYDFLNFLWWMLKIKLGKWFGPTGKEADRKLYCSELAALVMDHVRHSFAGKTFAVSPLDIDLNEDLFQLDPIYFRSSRIFRYSQAIGIFLLLATAISFCVPGLFSHPLTKKTALLLLSHSIELLK